MTKITTISGTFSGNRGAEAMLRSMIENIRSYRSDIMFNVLSVYPHDDVNECDYDGVTVIDARPKVFMIRCFLESFIYRFVSKRINARFSSASLAILESELVLDLSGVSFVDGRGLPILIYNVQCILIPNWFGIKTMKVSQAMGSFNNTLNRLLARHFLSKVDIIAARGAVTRAFLSSIGIAHEYCTDAAFSLELNGVLPESVENILVKIRESGNKIVGLCPSVVVKEYCDKNMVDYHIVMVKFIKSLIELGYSVLIFPHSARAFTAKTKNNDMPLCREIFFRGRDIPELYLIDELLNARELRLLISECNYFVGSRFHSVISALCVKTPFYLIGWSHKYAEVLDSFGISELALDFKDLTVNRLVEKFQEMVLMETKIIENTISHLPGVQDLSRKNAELAIELLRSNQ